MKKLLLLFSLTLGLSISMLAQGPLYKEMKALLKSEGYTISEEYYSDLAEGAFFYNTKMFYTDNHYLIVALSDDADVQDVDLYLYEEDGSEYEKDTDTDAMAVIHFEPVVGRTMKMSVKNYDSDTPNYESRCWLIVAFK